MIGRTAIAGFIAITVANAAFAGSGLPPWSEKSSALRAISTIPSGRQSKVDLDRLVDIGGKLFVEKFIKPDGAGRPDATQAIVPTRARHQGEQMFSRTSGLDSNACASCHNDPVPGGAGDFVTNVFVSEGFVNADFDSTDPQFSNERGTNHLFGSGLVELLAREMTTDLREIRAGALAEAKRMQKPVRVPLVTKDVSFGHLTALPDGLVDLDEVEGVDLDLIVRPFSQKGVMTSLRQFSVNALNHHHGMQAVERFGMRWTGTADFDGDGAVSEFAESAVSSLVAWQASRPVPDRMVPGDPVWVEMAAEGERYFGDFGCTGCHRPALPLRSLEFVDPGPLDAAGTLNSDQVEQPAVYDLALFKWADKLQRNPDGDYMVPLFGDLKRHVIADNAVNGLGNELLSQRFVDRNIFMTAELWGIASTAPFGHRNDITTLDEVIRAHGGEARNARDRYVNAVNRDREAVIAFLKTLVIDP